MRLAPTLALLAGLAGLAASAACGSARAPGFEPLSNASASRSHGHAPLATLERTACYGTCPVYKLTVYRDGTVEYTGVQFVKVTGKATGQITEDQVDEIEDLFLQSEYLKLKDAEHSYQVSDMQSAITSYTPPGGKAKAIRHDLGDTAAPQPLMRIEAGIDRLVHVERWIGTEAERAQMH